MMQEKPATPEPPAVLSEFEAARIIKDLNTIKNTAQQSGDCFQEYFQTLSAENKAYVAEYVDGCKNQKFATKDLVKSSQEAHDAQVAQNKAVQQGTKAAKAGEIAMKGFALAGNMIAMWAITKVIELVVNAIDNLINASEKCKQRVDELVDSYQSALSAANNTASKVEEIAPKYEALAKGVNNLGENVSLTADEFTEYQNIVGQIAEMFPNLITGYTDEGTAILSLKGNVDELRASYKALQQEAYQLLLTDNNDILTNYQNVANGNNQTNGANDKLNEYEQLEKAIQAQIDLGKTYSELSAEELSQNKLDQFLSTGNGTLRHEISAESGIDLMDLQEATGEELLKTLKTIQWEKQKLEAQKMDALSPVKDIANAYLMTNDDYTQMDAQTKTAASILVNSLNDSLAESFAKDNVNVSNYVQQITDSLQNNNAFHDAATKLFTSKYERQYLSGMKSLYESAFSYISGLIGNKIDALQDEKDAAIASYEQQKKAAEDAYQAEIKAIDAQISNIQKSIEAKQAEIDAIKEANAECQRAIDLQQKEYNLERMQNQKTTLQYKDGQMQYTTDTAGARDAKNEVDNAKEDIRLAGMEKEIKALEGNISALEEQKDAIQEMIDASNNYWDSMISSTESYFASLIKGMEDYQSRWDELSKLTEQAEMRALLEELGYTEEDVLNMSGEAFETLKSRYLDVLKHMNDGNQTVKDALSDLSGVELENLDSCLESTAESIDALEETELGSTTDSLNTVGDSLTNIGDQAGTAAQAIAGGGENEDNQENKGEEGNSPSSLKGAIEQQATTAGQVLPLEATQIEDLGTKANAAANYVDEIRENLDKLNGKTITTTILVNTIQAGWIPFAAGTVGSAYAQGTVGTAYKKATAGLAFGKGYPGLKHAVKMVLRSEYGQPELTLYPNGTTELTTEPTLSSLPKDTVIFNEEQTRRIMSNQGIYGQSTALESTSFQDANPQAYARYQKLSAYADNYFQNYQAIPNTPLLLTPTGQTANIKHTQNYTQPISINIGDIKLENVQDTGGLAKAIMERLPNAMQQEFHRRY